MIQEIIVVEGKSDTNAIRRAVEAETIETGGSAIDDQVIRRIQLAHSRRGVIVFTDPDHAGERIRGIITAQVPGCKHAFLDQRDATYKGKIGVEHATPEAIRKALAQVRSDRGSMQQGEIELADLVAAGLIHHPQAANRRLEMGRLLGIGYANGKQFYKRCQMFQITREEFESALRKLTSTSS